MTIQGLSAGRAISSMPLHLVEEITHRVANEYAEAIAALHVAALGAPNPHTGRALARAADRLRAHAAAHRALLPPEAGAPIDLGDYVGQLCASFSQASLADRGVRIALEADDIALSPERCWRVGLIVAELVRNAARHGLGGRTGVILVRLLQQAGSLSCMVYDNGGATAVAPAGRGRRLVQSLADELGGAVEWRFTPQGALVRLVAPLIGPETADGPVHIKV